MFPGLEEKIEDKVMSTFALLVLFMSIQMQSKIEYKIYMVNLLYIGFIVHSSA